jgi:RimJ/RimL family protein N-acetyltransferase
VPSREREDFEARWASNLAHPEILLRTITFDGTVAGHVTSFPLDGVQMVGYWIERDLWGRGIVSEALAQFLEIEARRPLYARVAAHNAGSIRVLEKAGFERHRELPDGVEFMLRAVR